MKKISAISQVATRVKIISVGVIVIAATGIATGVAVAASGPTSPRPELHVPVVASQAQVPNLPNIIRASGPLPFVETHGSVAPKSTASIPASIPTQGVVVNNDFELFPWKSSSTSGPTPQATKQAISSSAAISTCNAAIIAPRVTGTRTILADFTDPGAIPTSAHSSLPQSPVESDLVDAPSWIVDESMLPHRMLPNIMPGMSRAIGIQPTVANSVCVVNAYTGKIIFSTATP